jgi:hypothetical protein
LDELDVDAPHNSNFEGWFAKTEPPPGTSPELANRMLDLEKRMAGVRLYPLLRALFAPLKLTQKQRRLWSAHAGLSYGIGPLLTRREWYQF